MSNACRFMVGDTVYRVAAYHDEVLILERKIYKTQAAYFSEPTTYRLFFDKTFKDWDLDERWATTPEAARDITVENIKAGIARTEDTEELLILEQSLKNAIEWKFKKSDINVKNPMDKLLAVVHPSWKEVLSRD